MKITIRIFLILCVFSGMSFEEQKDIFLHAFDNYKGEHERLKDWMSPYYPIARFMNKNELKQYGWQFDHFHFEILKSRPRHLKPNANTPFRFFGTYCLECYNKTDLEKHYYNPKEYFKSQWLH